MLTLDQVAQQPNLLTRRLTLPNEVSVVFRQLVRGDAEHLAEFLGALSTASRRFGVFAGYDLAAARELCEGIGRYDKLRLALEETASNRIVGLFEFSFALPAADVARCRTAGVQLSEATDCRFGPTLADDYQGKGIGTLAFPLVIEVAKHFGKTRIVLWGGVLADNARAIRYYRKNGFQPIGAFVDPGGSQSLDMMLDLQLLGQVTT